MPRPPAEAVSLARHINAFLGGSAPARGGLSGHTAKSRRDALTLYIGFLESAKGVRPGDLVGARFDRAHIEEWLAWLSDTRGCRPSTLNNRLAAIRAFLKHLASKDAAYLWLREEAWAVDRARQPRMRPDGMTREAVKALMAAPDQSTKTGRRDLALMVVLYATACRIDEALSIKAGDLRLDGDRPGITVVGKGRKARTLHLPPKAVRHLRRHLAEWHGPAPDPEAYVFYSRNTGPKGKMTQAAVAKQLKTHAVAARRGRSDVPAGLHAHQFRHARASHWLADGMNVVQISFLLGHENVQTTMVYLDITTDHEAAALAALEDDHDKEATKKWKTRDAGLAGFCGLDALKQ